MCIRDSLNTGLGLKNNNLKTDLNAVPRFLKTVETLISAGTGAGAGSSQDLLDLQDNAGWTALMLATGDLKLLTLKTLISAGAGLDIQNNNGWTALMIASGDDILSLIHILIIQTLSLKIRLRIKRKRIRMSGDT